MTNILYSRTSHIKYGNEIKIFYNWCKSVYYGSKYNVELMVEPGSFRIIFNNIIK